MPPLLRSKFLTLILVVLCAWLVFVAVSATMRSLAARRELADAEVQIADQRRGNDRVAREVERMRQPSWLALLARARLNWRSPDESVVFVYKNEKSDTIAPPKRSQDARLPAGKAGPNWRMWWDWVRGK